MPLSNTEEIKIDLRREILAMAAKDGLKKEQQLDLPVTMLQRDYYKAAVIQYYRGRQDGYNESLLGTGTEIKKLLRRGIFRGMVVGGVVAIPFAIVIVKLFP